MLSYSLQGVLMFHYFGIQFRNNLYKQLLTQTHWSGKETISAARIFWRHSTVVSYYLGELIWV